MQLQLREYQNDAIVAIESSYNKGIHKQVAVLATGLGKTIIFSHLIAKRLQKSQKKALIIAHREELLLQAQDKLQRINPELRVGIEQADKIADHTHDDVIVASVQTIGRIETGRLQRFNPREFDTIIIDEAHHASSTTYKNVLRYFGVLKNEYDTNKSILLLGVTATPRRNDNQGIDQIFDEVTYEYTLLDGIKNNWLSRIKAFKVRTNAEIDSVHTVAGDFNMTELKHAVNTHERNELIIKMYKEKALGQQTLVFAVDVEHTRDLCLAFQDAGIEAAYITGETDRKERESLLNAFKAKQIHVMVNALVLTEGYDNEHIRFVFMARPTKSGILYQQMVGRGTRIHKDKPHLTIIDFVDNTAKHSLQTAASLIGLEGSVDFNGEDILSAKERVDELLEKRPYYDLDRLQIKNIDELLQEVNILQQEKEAKQQELYSWHQFGESMRMLSSKHRYYLVEQSMTGQYILSEYLVLAQVKKQVGGFLTLSEAMRYADSLLRQSYAGKMSTVGYSLNEQSSTSGELPSEAQISLLRELGADEDTIMFLDKHQASRLITTLKKGRGW